MDWKVALQLLLNRAWFSFGPENIQKRDDDDKWFSFDGTGIIIVLHDRDEGDGYIAERPNLGGDKGRGLGEGKLQVEWICVLVLFPL